MSAFTVAAAIAALDGADWLPCTLNWEIAATDGVWSAHCEIAADTVSEAYRLLCGIASAHDSKVGDDSRLLTVDFTYDDVPVRAWWLRPVKRWDVPERCATCPTKLGDPAASFVRLGVGSEAPVICVPCRDRMQSRWVKGDAARDAEVLRGAADVINALPQDYECDPGRGDAADLLRRMAEEAGKGSPTGGETAQPADFFQPGRTYAHGQTGYRAPEMVTLFRVEQVTRHPDRGHLRAIGWSRTGKPGSLSHGYFRDEGEFDGWTEVTEGGMRIEDHHEWRQAAGVSPEVAQ